MIAMIHQIEQTDHSLKGLRVKNHTQIRLKVQKRARKRKRNDNENNVPGNTQGICQLIGDEAMVLDNSDEPLGPDDIGFYTFFLGEGNPPDLLGIDDAQLRQIQNDLRDRLKTRDEAREQNYTETVRT